MKFLGKWNIPVFLYLLLFSPSFEFIACVFRTTFRSWVGEDGRGRHEKARELNPFALGEKRGKTKE